MSIKSEHYVVELQITVHNAIFVEILESQADFGGVELSSLCAKLSALDVKHQITTADILHDKVDTSFCLEARMQGGQERMTLAIGNQEDSLLRAHTLHFLVLNNKLLLQHLDSK